MNLKNLTPLLLVAVKLVKFVKLFKSFKILGAAASTASYTLLFGWKEGLILMGVLAIHESGHWLAMKLVGLKTKGIYFIPFLGAALVPEETFENRKQEAIVALGGPVLGLATLLIFYPLLWATGQAIWQTAIALVLLIHLLNLLPIHPLDGGRIIKSIAFSFNRKVGLAVFILGALLGAYVLFHEDHWIAMIIIGFFFVVSAVFEVFPRNIDREIEIANQELDYAVDAKEEEKFKKRLSDLNRQKAILMGFGRMPLNLCLFVLVIYGSAIGMLIKVLYFGNAA